MPVHTTTRRTPVKRRATPPTPSRPAPRPGELTAFTEEWWASWQRANALGWEYLNAVSGLLRLNMNAFARPTFFVPPFVAQ